MDGFHADLTAFNNALLVDDYGLYDILLDGVVAKVGASASPPVRFVTDVNTGQIILEPNDFTVHVTGHTYTAGVPIFTGTGNGTMGSISLDELTAVAETITVTMNAGVFSAGAPAYTGTGNGTMGVVTVDQPTAVVETITVTMTSATAFSVVGSVHGAWASGTTGVAYTGSPARFTITVGLTPFINGDHWTIVITQATPLTFAVSGSAHGAYTGGTVAVAYSGSPLHFTITAGLTAFVTGDHWAVLIS